MQAYDNDVDAGDSDDAGVLEGPDAFGASRAAFDELLATLGSAKAAGGSHDQLEEQLETDGRELLRRLYQDHLDLRALREQHAVATGRIGPITDARGIAHRKVEPGHLRQLATVFGTVRVTRCAWRANGARNLYPADAALNLPDRRHSHTPPAPRCHDPGHHPPRRSRWCWWCWWCWWWSAAPQGSGRHRQVADRLDRHHQRAG